MGLYKNENGILSPIAGRGNIDGVYKAQGILGAKNLLTYPYYNTTKTLNGVTFTDNGDGTITVDGECTAYAYFQLTPFTFLQGHPLPTDCDYILTGCPSGGGEDKYFLTFGRDSSTYRYPDYGEGVLVKGSELPNDTNSATVIGIYPGTYNNMIFKPMLRLASDTDSTYQPYAMTNKELTNVIDVPITWNFPEGVEVDYNYSHCYCVGKLCTLFISMRIGIPQANTKITIGSIPAKYIKQVPADDHPTNYGGFTEQKKFTTNLGLFNTENYIIGVQSEDGTIYIISDTVVAKSNHFISGLFTFPIR